MHLSYFTQSKQINESVQLSFTHVCMALRTMPGTRWSKEMLMGFQSTP